MPDNDGFLERDNNGLPLTGFIGADGQVKTVSETDKLPVSATFSGSIEVGDVRIKDVAGTLINPSEEETLVDAACSLQTLAGAVTAGKVQVEGEMSVAIDAIQIKDGACNVINPATQEALVDAACSLQAIEGSFGNLALEATLVDAACSLQEIEASYAALAKDVSVINAACSLQTLATNSEVARVQTVDGTSYIQRASVARQGSVDAADAGLPYEAKIAINDKINLAVAAGKIGEDINIANPDFSQYARTLLVDNGYDVTLNGSSYLQANLEVWDNVGEPTWDTGGPNTNQYAIGNMFSTDLPCTVTAVKIYHHYLMNKQEWQATMFRIRWLESEGVWYEDGVCMIQVLKFTPTGSWDDGGEVDNHQWQTFNFNEDIVLQPGTSYVIAVSMSCAIYSKPWTDEQWHGMPEGACFIHTLPGSNPSRFIMLSDGPPDPNNLMAWPPSVAPGFHYVGLLAMNGGCEFHVMW